MSVNRYFSPSVYSPELYVPPVDYIEKTLQKAQETYDTNFMVAQAMKNKYVDSLKQDRAKADEIQQGVEKKIDEIVAGYSGDYSQASKDLYMLQSSIDKMYNPGGEAHAIATNKATYDAAQKRELERLAKGEITQQQYAALMDNVERTYTGIGTKDKTGSYNMLNVGPLAEFVDEDEIFKEVEKTVPWRKSKVTKPVKGPDGYFTNVTEEVEYRDPIELQNAFESALISNDKYLNYARQLADLQGGDLMEQLQGQIYNYQQNIIPSYSGYKNQSLEHKLQEDVVAADYRKHRLAIELEGYKQKHRKELKAMDNEAAMGGKPELSVLTHQNTGYSRFKKINPYQQAPAGTVGSPRVINFTPSVDKLLANKSDKTINYELLGTIRASMKGSSDVDVIEAYNRTIDRGDTYGTETYYYKFGTTPAQKEEADRLVPTLASGQVPVYVLDTKTGETRKLTGTEVQTMYKEKWYDSEKRQSKVKAIGKSSPVSGNVPFGTVLDGGDGNYYIVGDNSVSMSRFNEDSAESKSLRKRAFDFIQNPGSNTSDVFEVIYDGQTIPVIGKKTYTFDSEAKVARPSVYYYPAVKGSNGKWTPGSEPYMTKGQPWEPFDISEMLITPERLQSSMPRNKVGTSSEGNTPFEIY